MKMQSILYVQCVSLGLSRAVRACTFKIVGLIHARIVYSGSFVRVLFWCLSRRGTGTGAVQCCGMPPGHAGADSR